MDRSPYNLIVPPKRRPPTRRAAAAHFQQKIDEDDVSHSTPPLHADEPIADLNPIFQPQYGSAGRYGSSRSMKAKHTYSEKDAHIISVPETTRGKSTATASAGYNNHSHPLQFSAQDFRHSSFQGQQQRNQFLNNNQGQMAESNAIIKYLKTTLFKQLYQVLRQLQRPKNEKPVSDLWLDGASKPLTGAEQRSRFLRYILPCILLVIANAMGILPSRFFRRSRMWNRLEERHLNGRQCVMNLFVDKHEANEFNPDYDPSNDKDHLPTPKPIEGTYRTKGQVEVINRFISSVAAAFRPNVSVQQHIVFAGTRDGGHLAQEALKHWPARGSYRTQLHIFAGEATDELEYDTIQHIEDRFHNDEEDVHIYDSNGNVAGHETTNDDDHVDINLRQQNRNEKKDRKFDTLPDLKTIIFENEDEEDSVIPYLHVDGTSMSVQMSILAQTEYLLKARKIVVVGLEHTPDLNVNELIEFFRQLEYKTFMLGLRQLTRIDNLCPEILHNVMQHPSLATSTKHWLPLSGGSSSSSSGITTNMGEHNNALSMPPFFVAMPRGRHNKEEMSIQHMYDLFSGASGLLQVKTANDRVANVK